MKELSCYVCIIIALCCACSSGNNVDDESINKSEVELSQGEEQIDEPESIFGKWAMFRRALYQENGESYIDYMPPSATAPVGQAHYFEISQYSVTHLIRVYPVKTGTNDDETDVQEAVFVGATRVISWTEDNEEVSSDIYKGTVQNCQLYSLEKDAFTLVFSDEDMSFSPAFYFSRIDDATWNQYSQIALQEGSEAYASALKEYDDYVKQYNVDSFSLQQFF